MIFASLNSGLCPMLTSLMLGSNDLRDKSLEHLVEHLQNEQCNLTSLDLSGNHISGRRFRDLLQHNRTLTMLDMRKQDESLADDDTWSMLGSILLQDKYVGALGWLSCQLFDLHTGLEELNLSQVPRPHHLRPFYPAFTPIPNFTPDPNFTLVATFSTVSSTAPPPPLSRWTSAPAGGSFYLASSPATPASKHSSLPRLSSTSRQRSSWALLFRSIPL